jgi:iron uptake system component EfeO
VQVLLTNDGCTPSPTGVAAGPVTFAIRNVGGDRVFEVELVRGDLIVGEKENLAPGLAGTFSVNLTEGRYQLYCPGATTEYTPFTASVPESTSALTPLNPELRAAFDDAASAYRTYVQNEVAQLVVDTEAFAAAIEAGDIAAAKQLYAPARVHYERIEPVAESFGELDPVIDMRADDADASTPFTGFHRLEQALWQDGQVDDMTPAAEQLVADTRTLQQLVNDATAFQFEPAQIANGSVELLDEVAGSKLSGEEERYSKLDLLDMAANIDGARTGYDLLRPGLVQLDPVLADTIAARFASLQATMAPYADDTGGWRSYDQLSPADVRSLSDAVNNLAEPLSQVAARVVVASGGSFADSPTP